MRRFFSWKRFSRERPYSGGIHWRAAWLFSLFSLGFTALYLRVGYLADSPGLAQTARQQAKYTLTVSETRGNIYDRELRLLVNKKTETVYGILPSAENLSPVLSAVPAARRAAVSEQFRSGRPFLLKDVSLSETLGVTAFSVPVRSGERQLAPHIVGYTDSDGKGVTGIEKSCDGFLSAASVKQTITYTLDGLGHSIPGIEPEIRSETGNGAGIVLSIDSIIQKVIENAGSAGLKKGAIVVMDPDTGEIRAAASFPFYTRSTLTQCLKDNENTPMINRAFLSYSVGSTFKVVTAAAALEEGISLTESYNCTGQIDVGGQIFRCHKRSGHGEVDMVDGMMKSCNPYFIHLGQLAGGEKLLKMAERFGFGDRVTLSEGMTVSGGTLPTLSQLQSPAAVANLSFGQGHFIGIAGADLPDDGGGSQRWEAGHAEAGFGDDLRWADADPQPGHTGGADPLRRHCRSAAELSHSLRHGGGGAERPAQKWHRRREDRYRSDRPLPGGRHRAGARMVCRIFSGGEPPICDHRPCGGCRLRQ